jgi:ERCC4-related helicase
VLEEALSEALTETLEEALSEELEEVLAEALEKALAKVLEEVRKNQIFAGKSDFPEKTDFPVTYTINNQIIKISDQIKSSFNLFKQFCHFFLFFFCEFFDPSYR